MVIFRTRQLLAIDFSVSYVKIALVKSFPNRKELRAVLVRPIAKLSDDDISKLIQTSVRELKIAHPVTVLTVAANQVISKNIEVPSVDPAEIREIINLQASRHTPHAREEVIIDYIPLATNKKSYTKVLLLIVAASAVKRHFAILEKAGLSVERVMLAQEGVAALYPGIFRLSAPGAVSAVIQVDEAASDCMVIARRTVQFIRSIPLGRQQLIGDASKAVPKFCEEAKKSLETYQTENIEGAAESLLVTGAVKGLENLDSALREAVQIPLQIKLFEAPGLLCTEKAAKALRETEEVSLAAVVAPLAAFTECRVNLIPEEIKLKKQLAQRSKEIVKTGVLLLVLLVAGCTVLLSKLYFRAAYLKALETKYSTDAQKARALEEDLQKINIVSAELKRRGSSVIVLAELHRLVPLSMELSEIRFEREGKFVVRGTAESMGTVFAFVDSLSKSKYFWEVNARNVNKRPEGKKDITDFEIQSFLKPKSAP